MPSSANGKHGRPLQANGGSSWRAVRASPATGSCGEYSRAQLLKMNARFVERMQTAIERALERRPQEGERAA